MTFGGKDLAIMRKWILHIVVLLAAPILWAQEQPATKKIDSIHLKEVVVRDTTITHNCPIAVVKIKRNYTFIAASNLAESLKIEAVFFKKYGSGGLSTISLRGTDASHTNVYWNGVNLNSNLNGQTDFSTLRFNAATSFVAKRSFLTSNAIGGNIILSDYISFYDNSEILASFGLGSFNTYDGTLQGKYTTDKWYTSLSFSKIESENDYVYYDTNIKNDNASYITQNVAATLAYKINSKQQLKLQLLGMLTDRNTARTLSSNNNAHLELKNNVALLNWQYKGDKQEHNLLFSIKDEKSNYQFDKAFDLHSKHQATQYTVSYIPKFIINDQQALTFYLANETIQASGDNILEAKTNLFKSKIHYQYDNDNFEYSLALGKDFSSDYDVPLSYNASASYKAAGFKFSTAISSNYRLPTFNDLYWNPGGNPNLKSEHSLNAELNINYSKNRFNNKLTFFIINSKDLIKWRPVSGMIWSPINVQRAQNYGLEYFAWYRLENFTTRFNYSFTKAVDLDLDKQLTYVPYHQARLNLRYWKYNNYSVSLLTAYTGKVFITTSNTRELPAYLTTDLSFSYYLTKPLQVRLELNNIFNTKYMAYADRPMPMRNFKIQLIYNPNFKQLNKNKNETNK